MVNNFPGPSQTIVQDSSQNMVVDYGKPSKKKHPKEAQIAETNRTSYEIQSQILRQQLVMADLKTSSILIF